ncbi:NUDIX domain-containing protein [Streptomyces sp. NPDC049906]|uniref:NUDIX domain-containing protein n=1 Tax=Streptomyces sp. NPDC049906 TaxID=3155656 RepID=UPI003425D507
MTHHAPPATGPEFFVVDRVRLAEVAPPVLPPALVAARDRVWEEAVRANPELFDGPVVACAGLAPDGAGGVVLEWSRATYRHRWLRRLPGAVGALPSLFVGVVQPVEDGRVLVARMAPWTSAPGRWQLPGGSVEPPAPGGALDGAALAREAARELVEELGVVVDHGELELAGIIRARGGGVGALYLAPPRSEAELRAGFAALARAERARGREPELVKLVFLGSVAELSGLTGPCADYLVPVLEREGRRTR